MVMFGVIGLLVVGYVAQKLLATTEKRVAPVMRDIPMAITDISPGTVMTERHLGMGKVPVDQLTREMLLTNRVIVGRVSKTPLKAAPSWNWPTGCEPLRFRSVTVPRWWMA
jgi:hypothetical protein